jgi:hypothetical protein
LQGAQNFTLRCYRRTCRSASFCSCRPFSRHSTPRAFWRAAEAVDSTCPTARTRESCLSLVDVRYASASVAVPAMSATCKAHSGWERASSAPSAGASAAISSHADIALRHNSSSCAGRRGAYALCIDASLLSRHLHRGRRAGESVVRATWHPAGTSTSESICHCSRNAANASPGSPSQRESAGQPRLSHPGQGTHMQTQLKQSRALFCPGTADVATCCRCS